MMDDVYNAKVLELAGNIGRIGRLESPDATAKAHSRLCGSTVVVDLCMKDGRVTDFAHEVKACMLGQASSAIMADHVVGSTAEELRELRETMLRMLKENGPPPVPVVTSEHDGSLSLPASSTAVILYTMGHPSYSGSDQLVPIVEWTRLSAAGSKSGDVPRYTLK